ncbi:hypothetical protein HBB16_05650 [Pseudonocardia sp. MCCB 268]|nr:hypothetical protein [Pseudonocardia cytotoxica]
MRSAPFRDRRESETLSAYRGQRRSCCVRGWPCQAMLRLRRAVGGVAGGPGDCRSATSSVLRPAGRHSTPAGCSPRRTSSPCRRPRNA